MSQPFSVLLQWVNQPLSPIHCHLFFYCHPILTSPLQFSICLTPQSPSPVKSSIEAGLCSLTNITNLCVQPHALCSSHTHTTLALTFTHKTHMSWLTEALSWRMVVFFWWIVVCLKDSDIVLMDYGAVLLDSGIVMMDCGSVLMDCGIVLDCAGRITQSSTGSSPSPSSPAPSCCMPEPNCQHSEKNIQKLVSCLCTVLFLNQCLCMDFVYHTVIQWVTLSIIQSFSEWQSDE